MQVSLEQLAEKKVTPFQLQVYKAISLIPAGKVSTYKEVANAIGCGSCQAVGQALKRNPFAPTVPCHRVISTDLTIGGFFGKIDGEQIDKKLKLLKEEGVDFKDGKLISSEAIFAFI